MSLLHSLTDVSGLLAAFGLAGVAAVVFVESGLLVGFFLPGDSLLFSAGMLTSGPDPIAPLWLLVVVTPLAAIAGDQLVYTIGARTGPAVMASRAMRRIGDCSVDRAVAFFRDRGAAAVVLARFIPVVRTVVPVLAGVARMDRGTFTRANALGGVLWGVAVSVAGHFLGEIAVVREHIDLLLVGIVAVSLLPVAVHLLRARSAGAPTASPPRPRKGAGSS